MPSPNPNSLFSSPLNAPPSRGACRSPTACWTSRRRAAQQRRGSPDRRSRPSPLGHRPTRWSSHPSRASTRPSQPPVSRRPDPQRRVALQVPPTPPQARVGQGLPPHGGGVRCRAGATPPPEDKAKEDRSKEASVLPPRNRVSHHGGCYIRCFSFFLLLLSIASPRCLIW